MSSRDSNPHLCENCGQGFPSYRLKNLHSHTQCIQRKSSSGANTNKAEHRRSSSSNGYGTHPPYPNTAATETTLPTGSQDIALSPQGYLLSPQSYHSSEKGYFPPPASSATLPPDVAAARLSRINREISERFRIPPDPRNTDAPVLRGIGTYTHVDSQQSRQFSPVPQFLPLGGPLRYERGKRIEPELPEAVNKAYEVLEKILREEERREREGDRSDPRVRYGALPVPESMDELPPPPPPLPNSNPPRIPPPPPPPIDTGIGGINMGREANSATTAKSTSWTTVHADRDPRLMRRHTENVYGRR
ncbi:hypothetical protein K505DRAFT_370249 [Melanomma pulvis-pyrius CBS 109.77]|uniref:Uncharacterized protein n=1 Tax=Melanomma pulvis-pyrius CBS 109.77 TaxID=1314802 RepID=A0A6A6XWU9_9PLEO|nr:hypothetical protein K505DRAFT_370249 [Melanomma pulvis-pyrius CBS 109.77]